MFLSTYQRHTFSTFMNMDRSIESWNVLKWNGKNCIGIKGSAVFKTSSWLLNIGQSVESRINEGWRVGPEAEVALEAVMRRRWGSCWGMSFSGAEKIDCLFEHAKRSASLPIFFPRQPDVQKQLVWGRKIECVVMSKQKYSAVSKKPSPLFFLQRWQYFDACSK